MIFFLLLTLILESEMREFEEHGTSRILRMTTKAEGALVWTETRIIITDEVAFEAST